MGKAKKREKRDEEVDEEIKRHKAWEPTRRESGMGPGQSQEADQVVSDVQAAKAMLEGIGQPFDVAEVLKTTKYQNLPDVEKAYVQDRLKREIDKDLPDELKPPPSAIEQLEAERKSAQLVEREPVVDSVEPEEPELTPEQIINGLCRLVKSRFAQAQADNVSFNLENEIAQYQDQLGDDGVKTLRRLLQSDGVKDISEPTPPKTPEAEQMPTGKLLFVEFEYKDGQLYVVRKSEKTGKKLKPKLCTDKKFALPKSFAEVAKDADKLKRALKELGRLYVYSVEPLPRSWRSTGKMDSFEVFFPGTQEGIPLPSDVTKMEDVNRILGALKERERAGEKIDYNKEGYWQAPGFDAWREGHKKIIAEKYIQEKKREIMEDLGIELDVSEPVQSKPSKEEEPVVVSEPPEKAEPGDKKITPAEVGMSDETADKLKVAIEKLLVDSYAKKIREKHPLEDFPRMTDARVRAVAEGYVTDTDVEDLFQAKLRQIKDKQARTS